MTTTEIECVECGRIGTDGFEQHTYRGLDRKRRTLPRCSDRRGCERRLKRENEEAHAEILAEAAGGLRFARQAVKDAEAELSRAVKGALKAGVAATTVAQAAGISRERVYQIRDGRR
jgi:hypothetical protein